MIELTPFKNELVERQWQQEALVNMQVFSIKRHSI